MELTEQRTAVSHTTEQMAAVHERIDAVHRFCSRFEPATTPLTHRFTPGLYSREVFLPKNTLAISEIHKTEHPFVVLTGSVRVFDAYGGVTLYGAGHVGITRPGTRRIVFAHEDTRWITFHPTTKTDLDEIKSELIEPRVVLPEGDFTADILKLLTEGKA